MPKLLQRLNLERVIVYNLLFQHILDLPPSPFPPPPNLLCYDLKQKLKEKKSMWCMQLEVTALEQSTVWPVSLKRLFIINQFVSWQLKIHVLSTAVKS